MRWLFSRSFKSFSLSSTIINFLFASLKLLTTFEIAYWNPPQNFLLCDERMYRNYIFIIISHLVTRSLSRTAWPPAPQRTLLWRGRAGARSPRSMSSGCTAGGAEPAGTPRLGINTYLINDAWQRETTSTKQRCFVFRILLGLESRYHAFFPWYRGIRFRIVSLFAYTWKHGILF